MSAPDGKIESAFTARLASFGSLPIHPTGMVTNGWAASVAWGGKPFTPDINTPYIKPTLSPAEPTQAEIGQAGINRHTGVYYISVFAPAGKGLSTLNTLRDGLIDHFKRGTHITYSDVLVKLFNASTAKMPDETDWLHSSISIRYTADAAN